MESAHRKYTAFVSCIVSGRNPNLGLQVTLGCLERTIRLTSRCKALQADPEATRGLFLPRRTVFQGCFKGRYPTARLADCI